MADLKADVKKAFLHRTASLQLYWFVFRWMLSLAFVLRL